MSLQFFEFANLPLQFVILEPCHCNFTNLRNTPLRTPSPCFLKFMDQITLGLFLPPLIIPCLFLSISVAKSPLSASPQGPNACATASHFSRPAVPPLAAPARHPLPLPTALPHPRQPRQEDILKHGRGARHAARRGALRVPGGHVGPAAG